MFLCLQWWANFPNADIKFLHVNGCQDITNTDIYIGDAYCMSCHRRYRLQAYPLCDNGFCCERTQLWTNPRQGPTKTQTTDSVEDKAHYWPSQAINYTTQKITSLVVSWQINQRNLSSLISSFITPSYRCFIGAFVGIWWRCHVDGK
jgi:hypothetical protein